MNDLITKLRSGENLTPVEVEAAAAGLLDAEADAEMRKSLLRSLAAKGETPEEIAGLATAFLARAVDPQLSSGDLPKPLLDVCGTGGDKLNLFNVSTTCTFVLAAAGMGGVKHGNKGITSKSGGADVLQALGVPIDLAPEEFSRSVRDTGMGFLFAPLYHPAFKAVAPLRKELAQEGVRTVFNLLGPLLNPVRPDYQVIGVFSPDLPPIFAEILRQLGRKCAWTVNGQAGGGTTMDEFSTLGPNLVVETREGEVLPPRTVDPKDLGFTAPSLESLQGDDAEVNAKILQGILEGRDRGPRRDLVLLNSAAGLAVTGMAADLPSGIARAADLIDSGAAEAKLREVQEWQPDTA